MDARLDAEKSLRLLKPVNWGENKIGVTQPPVLVGAYFLA